jgi:hypothetical protein
LAVSIFTAISYGYLYLLFTTFPTVFHVQYGFSTGTVGLSYIGLGVGCFPDSPYAGSSATGYKYREQQNPARACRNTD